MKSFDPLSLSALISASTSSSSSPLNLTEILSKVKHSTLVQPTFIQRRIKKLESEEERKIKKRQEILKKEKLEEGKEDIKEDIENEEYLDFVWVRYNDLEVEIVSQEEVLHVAKGFSLVTRGAPRGNSINGYMLFYTKMN